MVEPEGSIVLHIAFYERLLLFLILFLVDWDEGFKQLLCCLDTFVVLENIQWIGRIDIGQPCRIVREGLRLGILLSVNFHHGYLPELEEVLLVLLLVLFWSHPDVFKMDPADGQAQSDGLASAWSVEVI